MDPGQRFNHLPPRPRSPAPSGITSHGPPTPDAVSETASNYFEAPLSSNPSPSALRLNSYSTASADPGAQRPLPERFRSREPSIRIRRSSNSSLQAHPPLPQTEPFPSFDNGAGSSSSGDVYGRIRSFSQPERAHVAADAPATARHSRRVPPSGLPRLTEEGARPTMEEMGLEGVPLSPTLSEPPEGQAERRRKMQKRSVVGRMFWPDRNRNDEDQNARARGGTAPPVYASQAREREYESELVDWLDIIDPEVQTLSTLTNVQNSLFVPDLGHWVNRRPTYVLSHHAAPPVPQDRREPAPDLPRAETEPVAPTLQRSSTITSRLTDSHYAALPHGITLDDWTHDEKMELDDHVRHMLHSRRSRMKRRLKGFGQYVRRPLGFFVTLYATLITLFGLAWVLFLIGWIYVGSKQVYIIHIIDSVLVALFAVMGDGLAPFRAVDTYHMIFIWRYTRIVNKAKAGKPPRNRLKKAVPTDVQAKMLEQQRSRESSQSNTGEYYNGSLAIEHERNGVRETEQEAYADVEEGKQDDVDDDDDDNYFGLTPKQKKSLEHHKKKMSKSHSFYKPRETLTHHSFPLAYLIGVVILLDCHSLLQISLGACTWGIDYRTRPFAITTVILCISIACNITAGLVITLGDRKTRKKDVVKLLDRQELTNDAIKLMEKRRKENGDEESEPKGSSKPGPSSEADTAGNSQSPETDSGRTSTGKLRKEASIQRVI
ncbi:hypothetical protein S7711_02725 [Stachybotrys chartarum IBT 7711]|uniref:Integral membrane protein n=1 Tax=Stachybotrys chartarum (strain CBS 109288 / IBT 7711) TaxID=1280523 RepID=A0A084AZ46_STACB|nr:hypothetical protein S7711_02725 [Stachybotrys chartarum IBT 7711]KFA45978.1 hypothetical protein S40293_09201 [Stachybotrys chartarum IBT 40293]